MPTDTSQSNSPEDPYEDYCWATEALAEYLREYHAKKIINLGSDSVFEIDLKGNK